MEANAIRSAESYSSVPDMRGGRAETGVLADGKYSKGMIRDLGKPSHSAISIFGFDGTPNKTKPNLLGARLGALGKIKNKPRRCSRASQGKPREPDDGGSLTNP